MNNKEATVLILLDFSKAFDSINHSRLLQKLSHIFRFSSTACSLIKSYLTDRYQCVSIDEELSEFIQIRSGVPQGSVLGPLLFCLYISDIKSCFEYSFTHNYADDVQIYRSCRLDEDSVNNCIEKLNSDLKRVNTWALQNSLQLNASKSKSIVIYKSKINTNGFPSLILNNDIIPFSCNVTNLGLIFNQNLTWDEHILNKCSKIFVMLRSFWKLTTCTSCSFRRSIFMSYIFPHFLYADVVMYGMSSRCKQMLKLCFNACIRYIYKLRKYNHVSEYVPLVLGCELDVYYEYRCCLFILKLIQNQQPVYLFEKLKFSSNFKHNLRLNIQSNNCLTLHRSLFVSGIKLWNTLPLSIKQQNSKLFYNQYLTYKKSQVYVT